MTVSSDNGYQVRGICPLHHGDNPTAFAIRYKDDSGMPCFRWECHTKCCKSGDIIDYVREIYSVSFNSAMSWLSDLFHMDRNVFTKINTGDFLDAKDVAKFNADINRIKHTAEVDPENFDININENFVNTCVSRRNQYFSNRGYTEEVLDMYDVGFCPEYCSPSSWRHSPSGGARVTIPIRDQYGELCGMSGRTMKTSCTEGDKYKNLHGTRRGFTLYGLDVAEKYIAEKKSIILTEGYADVWRAWMHGKRNTVGVMGTKLTSHQTKLILSRANTVAIAMDNDKAGREAEARIAEKLKDFVTLYHIPLPDNTDVGEIESRDEFYFCLKNARKIN